MDNFFARWSSTKAKLTPTSTPEQVNGSYFYPIQMAAPYNWQGNDAIFLDAFETVPEINAILNLKASAHANGKIQILSKRTDEPFTGQTNLPKLLYNPNWFQNQKEFIIQTNLFRNIFGNEYLYLNVPVGMNPKSAKALYTIPPQVVDFTYDKTNPYFFDQERPEVKMVINWNGMQQDFPDMQNVQHLNDNRVNVGGGSYLKGTSKMQALIAPIQNVKGAYESRGVLIYKRGALGILSNETKDSVGTVPIDKKDKEQLQADFRKYGLMGNQADTIITNAALRWQSMVKNVNQLGLFEEVQADVLKFCDSFGVPYELLSSLTGTTYENQDVVWKRFYQDTIMPEAAERTQALNDLFQTEKESWYIATTFDHLSIFSEDLETRASTIKIITDALSTAYNDTAITNEEYRQVLEEFKMINR